MPGCDDLSLKTAARETLMSKATRQQRPGESPQRRTRRSPEEIMQRLMAAATEEFQQSGFGGATTAAIARRAEVTEAQLFRYFDSKAAIFQAAIFQPLSEKLAAFNDQYITPEREDNIRDSANLYIGELQKFIAENSKYFMSLIVADAYAPDILQGVNDIESLQTYFQRGADTMRKRIDGKPTVDPKLMVRVSFAAVLGCVMFKDWMFPKGMASQKAIREAIIHFVIDGINANEDPGLKDLHKS